MTANRIVELRTAAGLTREQLAEKLGTSASQVAKLERGERKLTTDWIRRLAAAMSIPADDVWQAAQPSSPSANDDSAAGRLRLARTNAGFASASDAARSLGVKIATYVHHENGTREFDEDAARLYARRYRVSLAWLMFGEDDRPAPAGDETLRDSVALAVLPTLIANAPQGTFWADICSDAFSCAAFLHGRMGEAVVMALPEIIRSARLAAGLSQASVAEMARTTQQTVDRVERGLTKNSSALLPIMSALGLSTVQTEDDVTAAVSRKPFTITVRLTQEQRDRLETASTIGPYRVALTEIIARGIELAAQELERMAAETKRWQP